MILNTFFTWIEYNNKVYTLTDNEIFSNRGQLLFSSKLPFTNVFGAYSIRFYYDLDTLETKEYTINDFWDIDKIPEIFRPYILNIEKYYTNSFVYYMDPIELVRMIELSPTKYQQFAFDILFKQKTKNIDLSFYLKELMLSKKLDQNNGFVIKSKIWDYILKNQDLYILMNLVIDSSNTYRDQAWKELSSYFKKWNHVNDPTFCIILSHIILYTSTNDYYHKEAQQLLKML